MLVSNDVRSISSFDSIVDLDVYIEKKDLCCLLYLGNSAEYILLLNLLKEHIHKKFDNISFKVACKTNIIEKLKYQEIEFIKDINLINLKDFGFVYEIKLDLQNNTHPLEDLVKEIDHKFKTEQQNTIKFAKIFPQGSFPIKSLTESQIKIIENIVKKNGIEITKNDELIDWAIGTQNIDTYLHASKGLKTTMVNVDLGKNLIKRLYESVEFLNI